jgi:hypothetical protein
MKDQYEITAPKPAALIESLRSVGYSLATALADIVDNSISANANNIWMEFQWDGASSRIWILDDGRGMPEDALVEAMRPGTTSPLEERSPADLGRFGLGLKTASFSQCRRLTVWSRADGGNPSARCWDLNYVAKHEEWRLLKPTGAPYEYPVTRLMELKSGTLVIWDNLDRVVDNDSVTSGDGHNRFNRAIKEVESHLGMIFHRFIEGNGPRSSKLNLFINGRDSECLIKPWNPFQIAGAPLSQEKPVERLRFAGQPIEITGYVLPHKDRLTESQYDDGGGPRGWLAQQGFYIYRANRMLVAGDWLKLGRLRQWQKDEHYKLARLMIDLPNTMDGDWCLDIKKSTARPPGALRSRLTDLGDEVRNDARELFVHRGTYGKRAATPIMERPWNTATRCGRTVYKINRNHPVIAELSCQLGPLAPKLIPLLKLLEETVPVERIWLNFAESPNEHSTPFQDSDESEVRESILLAVDYLTRENVSAEALRVALLATEPFRQYPEIVEAVIRERSTK